MQINKIKEDNKRKREEAASKEEEIERGNIREDNTKEGKDSYFVKLFTGRVAEKGSRNVTEKRGLEGDIQGGMRITEKSGNRSKSMGGTEKSGNTEKCNTDVG